MTVDTEIWLYGSTARGDRLPFSDVDVLVAGSGVVVLDQFELPIGAPLSVTRYTWGELEQMASYGSLFLHHVRLEGRRLDSKQPGRLSEILNSLGPYARADQELASFLQVLDDVERSLTSIDCSLEFELSVVATAARHAAILGCYLAGTPDFGRTSAFDRFLPSVGYSASEIREYHKLYDYRRAEDERRPPGVECSLGMALSWAREVRNLIEHVAQMARIEAV